MKLLKVRGKNWKGTAKVGERSEEEFIHRH
jgi:hypothetical protein